uniref:Solute carrier family 23 member 2 n=1 Tax=Neogobius melanostomus TaxID=47308 RepID=A0A8C6TVR0_9GOBI
VGVGRDRSEKSLPDVSEMAVMYMFASKPGLYVVCMSLQMDEPVRDEATGKHSQKGSEERDRNKPTYCVTDVPPWYLCIFLAFQHYLTAFGGIITIPLLLSERLCLQHDSLTQGRLINNIFFVSGICTVLQVTLGVRLPILQGGTFALVTPAMALLSLPEFQCPAWTQNASLVNTSSPVFIDLQGSIMVASVLQIVVGFSGLIGFLMRFIGPLTIAPTVSVIGLSLYDVTGDEAGSHWGISALTAVLIVLFSQYLCRVPLPAPSYNRVRKWHTSKFFIFQNVPVCITSGYMARTDVKERVIGRAAWLSFPYPALAGVWFGNDGWDSCAPWQSLWDYHLCARLSGDENIGALGITKVRWICHDFNGNPGKVGAIFSTIPTPVIGGMLLIMFSVIGAAGISNLQTTDMNSSRNIFIFGVSVFSALTIPNWIRKNPHAIDTGANGLDQVLQILLTTNMFIGGFLGCFLDNTIPGTKRERGILCLETAEEESASSEVYGLPFGISASLSSHSWLRSVPFCPWDGKKTEFQRVDSHIHDVL